VKSWSFGIPASNLAEDRFPAILTPGAPDYRMGHWLFSPRLHDLGDQQAALVWTDLFQPRRAEHMAPAVLYCSTPGQNRTIKQRSADYRLIASA
jgi:hypothetical protein